MKPKGESALRILCLQPFSRKGNAKKSSQEMMDMMGGIITADVTYEG